MRLSTYERIVSLLKGDIRKFILLGLNLDAGNRQNRLKRVLLNAIISKGLWIWDSFNFETMTVPQAIALDSLNRIVEEPKIESDIYAPGVGFTFIETTEDKNVYNIIVHDIENNSNIISVIQNNFETELVSTKQEDGIYSWTYKVYV